MIIVCLFIFPILLLAQHHSDLVVGLIPEYKHNWYSGFLNVSSSKALHYVFFPSQYNPNGDPLIVWLGSELGYSTLNAMAYQNGPFRFETNSSSYTINNHTWNKEANLLYIECLPSVGFSIGDLVVSEELVAQYNLQSLIDFFAKYPYLRSNKMYLSGSGYAGTFASYLALQIHEHNSHYSTLIKINLQGMLLGNPCIHHNECFDVGVDAISYKGYEFLYKHGFLTETQFLEIKSACSWDVTSTACFNVRTRYEKKFSETHTALSNIHSPCYYQLDHYGDIKCEDSKGADSFFNNPEVQLKLHVLDAQRDWKVMNHEAAYKFKGNENGSYLILPTLMKYYRVWIYSGDFSANVPLTDTLDWIQKLRDDIHLPVMEPWRQWWTQGLHTHEDQVAGMVWKLNNLTLVTIRAGGFYTARDKPQALEQLLDNFLNGIDLPRKGEL